MLTSVIAIAVLSLAAVVVVLMVVRTDPFTGRSR